MPALLCLAQPLPLTVGEKNDALNEMGSSFEFSHCVRLIVLHEPPFLLAARLQNLAPCRENMELLTTEETSATVSLLVKMHCHKSSLAAVLESDCMMVESA